jgi:molybdopterin molybdotransferase
MSWDPIAANALPLERAREVVERHAALMRPRATKTVALLESFGRVLAEPIIADRDFPPFARATRDGYAILASDVVTFSSKFAVIGEIKAGAASSLALNRGQAVAIMTGAPVPAGADTVVMVENVLRDGDTAEITKTVVIGENVVPAGAEARRGDQILPSGMRIDYVAVALAAAVGKASFQVYRRPRIAILATGDEVVDVTADPSAVQIRNSNSYSLAAQVHKAGGEPVILPIAADEPSRLRDLIVEGLTHDLLLMSGGVSMGKHDLVETVLAELGAEFLFTGVLIQPGRPVVFGHMKAEKASSAHIYFFGLPGNPVSTMVTFQLFVRPAIEALSGGKPGKLIYLYARLKSEIKTKRGLTRFLPALLTGEFGHPEVELIPWQGSGDMAAAARANCYAVIPPDQDRLSAGESIGIVMR